MKTNDGDRYSKIRSKEKGLENKTGNLQQNVPAQKDGFRYDYNDSSEFMDDKMT